MVNPERPRRLVINADDFGRSHLINQAVVQAHREGILTSASLMVNGNAAAEAVELARELPNLGVGLHLTLLCGRACLGPDELAGLVDARSFFRDQPVRAGLRYFFQRQFRGLIEKEMAAQFERFHATGLVLDHVNGHLHFHMHPTIMRILLRRARDWGIRAMRLTKDPIRFNLRLSRGRYVYRLRQGLIFGLLSRWVQPQLRKAGLVHVDRVFGLLQDDRVDARYVEDLITRLPAGSSELYSHPSLEGNQCELEALTAPQLRNLVRQQGILLSRYQEL